MTKRIHIKTLTPQLITRRRGFEAYEKLLGYLADSVEIDLTDVDLISYSFLDELIYRIAELGKLGQVGFIIDDETVLDKLARIAGVRSKRFRMCTVSEKTRLVKPKQFITHQPVFASSKE